MNDSLQVVQLTEENIGEIMALEKRVCISLIQASPETILKRFGLGNIMLGARLRGSLVGSIGFRFGNFSPDDFSSFPTTFSEFSTPSEQPMVYNAGFVYSVNVDPAYRILAIQPQLGKTKAPNPGIGRTLVTATLQRLRNEGCQYLVGDARPAFYHGSCDFSQERYEQDHHCKSLLDKHAAGQMLSDTEMADILSYPVFGAYNKFLGGGLTVAWILPNFFPGDIPAGGFRIIIYKDLQ